MTWRVIIIRLISTHQLTKDSPVTEVEKSKAIDEFINVTAFYHLPTLRGFCESGKTLGP